ncbi:Copia-like poly retrotransposon [Fusarium pseudoanthophilum]|uniref:Copia-like poly retrotransposon n=1 Tax=Fusarium pseudoanthophilum TaxID=48495 RepID=A0A8H5LFS2_9HYPO|nr:Copia-like poly retrotransposon [Fusarium pseudoanthophilum]
MAPNNKNNKSDQPEILGTVSKGSIRFNSQAASFAEKRGRSLVAEQSSVAKKSKRQKKVPMAERHCYYCQRKGHYASACPKKEEEENKLRSQGAKFAQEPQDPRFAALEQRLSAAEKKADAVAAAAATEEG